jgi:hypothetical protein
MTAQSNLLKCKVKLNRIVKKKSKSIIKNKINYVG